MKLDIFLSICQTEVDGQMPNERQMFQNFFSQLKLADDLGFGTAWVAETHLSCEVQKLGPQPVIPYFKGEIGLNSDILQLAHAAFPQTKRIHIGSAIRNILCNGGPVAHAEQLQAALTLMQHSPAADGRKLEIGFASGRFEFSNRPYGIVPRNDFEKRAWAVVKGKALHHATEIFLRLLNGDTFSSDELEPMVVGRSDFRTEKDWVSAGKPDGAEVHPFWKFEKLGIIPRETSQEALQLTLGSHDPALQERANRLRPVRVFNLSITPPAVIEETHARMKRVYHSDGGPWQRSYMPRTAMIFVSERAGEAQAMAKKAWENYWRAMEGTLDPQKVAEATSNTLAGTPAQLVELLKQKYHPEDRLMCWFDFNNHDNDSPGDKMIRIKNLINGELVEPVNKQYMPNFEPATGEVYSECPDSDALDVVQAIQAAQKAFVKWSKTTVAERARIMNRIADLMEARRDEFAAAEAKDMGKPLWIARVL
jgi:alkanesulfonate monooxygenase SsuD/methylene tetrahydromethanopterin reductase-like flavin-dependent oxidoreductase (luciferase family)